MCSLRIHAAISLVSLALVSASAGYLLRAQKTDGSLVLSVKDVVQEEYLVHQILFPGLKTLRTLWTLCVRACAWGSRKPPAHTSNWLRMAGLESQAAVVLERAIRDAEAVVREFEGTEQQFYVLQDHLRLLERSGRFDLWTRFYLKALTASHPPGSVPPRREAVKIGKLAGQQEQVLRAAVPAARPEEFAGRAEIEAALATVQPYFAQVEGQ